MICCARRTIPCRRWEKRHSSIISIDADDMFVGLQALHRLTPREEYDRAYRIRLASQLSVLHHGLPKEQVLSAEHVRQRQQCSMNTVNTLLTPPFTHSGPAIPHPAHQGSRGFRGGEKATRYRHHQQVEPLSVIPSHWKEAFSRL